MKRLNNDGIGALVVIAIILALLISGTLAFMLTNRENDIPDQVNIDTPTADEITPEDDDLLSKILDNPTQYYGQQVTVRGEIQDVYTSRVFKISDQTIGQELLIITPKPLSQRQVDEAEDLLEDNADVRATGTIRQLVLSEVESELSLDLDEQIEVEFENKPVLIANSLTFSDNNAILDFTQGPDGSADNPLE
jgi:hypothetical protein